MAQRFYFDLKNGHDFIRDNEGVEAHDLDQATDEAQAVIDEMRDRDDFAASNGEWSLAIRDERGTTLKTLPVT